MDNATMIPDQGLQQMNIQQINDYLDDLVRNKIQPESKLEASALQNFRQISGRVDSLHASLRRAESQVEQFKAEINSSTGELKAYANILASAEDGRLADKVLASFSEDKNEGNGNGEAKTAAPASTDPVEPKVAKLPKRKAVKTPKPAASQAQAN